MHSIKLCIFMFSLCISAISEAQLSESAPQGKYFVIKSDFIRNGSGQNPAFTLCAAVVKDRKSIEVGLMFDPVLNIIAGVDVKYRLFFVKENLTRSEKQFFPYISYNIIYQKGRAVSGRVIELNGVCYTTPCDSGTIATMGHFLEYGNYIRIIKNLFLEFSVGMGVYEGSVDQVNGPGTFGIHWRNSGMTYEYKIGIAYSISEHRKHLNHATKKNEYPII